MTEKQCIYLAFYLKSTTYESGHLKVKNYLVKPIIVLVPIKAFSIDLGKTITKLRFLPYPFSLLGIIETEYSAQILEAIIAKE